MSTVRPPSPDLDFEGPPEMPIEALENPVSKQVELLRMVLNSKHPDPKQIKHQYRSAINLCASYGNIDEERVDEAIMLLRECEEAKIFADDPEQRAELHSKIILKLIEKGFHAKANELYKEAIGKGLWKDYPKQQRHAEEKLSEVGFPIQH